MNGYQHIILEQISMCKIRTSFRKQFFLGFLRSRNQMKSFLFSRKREWSGFGFRREIETQKIILEVEILPI